MSWFKRHFGLDPIDVAIQFVLTLFIAGAVDSFIRGPGQEAALFGVATTSLLLFAVRRHFALRKIESSPLGLTSGQMAATRLEDVEQRLAELENAQMRVAELEERLDFAERLLAQHGLGVSTGQKVLEERR